MLTRVFLARSLSQLLAGLSPACTNGTYKEVAGFSYCAVCPGNFTTAGMGATSLANCVCPTGWAGAACDMCADGFYGPTCQACASCIGICVPGQAGNCTGTHARACKAIEAPVHGVC